MINSGSFQSAAELIVMSAQNVHSASTKMDLLWPRLRATFTTATGPALYTGTQFVRKKRERFDVKRYLSVFLTLGGLMLLSLGRCPALVLVSPQVPPELLHFIGFNFPGRHIPVCEQIFASAQLKVGLVPIFVCEPSQTFNNHPKKQIGNQLGEFYCCPGSGGDPALKNSSQGIGDFSGWGRICIPTPLRN